ncbi:MAG: amidohydrolase family protein [Desulfobacteraceae bacterium]|nr:amidohydrolase family protein [Desulfobacteraceae bacterium]
MTIDLQTWLALTVEDPIEPELPIIDPHHHLWEYPNSRYLLKELLEDIGSGHNIVQTVFVECLSQYRLTGPKEMRPVGETEFVRDIATSNAAGQFGPTQVAAGIVGFADLTLGDAVVPVLEAHLEAGDGRFRGIRHAVAWHASDQINNAHTRPPEGLLMDLHYREGFACLRKFDLSFDAWIYHTQMAELAELARAFGDTLIILDHVGTPLGIGPYEGQRKEGFTEWRRGIDILAACDNVVVKLGGLGMKVCGFGWHRQPKPPTSQMLAEAMAPYINYCLERFGVARCMFESNFPVDRPSCAYGVLWNAFKRISASMSPAEKAALFHGNAARAYGLDA